MKAKGGNLKMNIYLNHGLVGELKVENAEINSSRLTFKNNLKRHITDTVLRNIKAKYNKYLESHNGFMPGGKEANGVFTSDVISIDIENNDLRTWRDFLKKALSFATYQYIETCTTAYGLSYDIAIDPNIKTVHIMIQRDSEIKIPKFAAEKLLVHYRKYVHKLDGMQSGEKYVLLQQDKDKIFYEVNIEDLEEYIEYIKKVLA